MFATKSFSNLLTNNYDCEDLEYLHRSIKSLFLKKAHRDLIMQDDCKDTTATLEQNISSTDLGLGTNCKLGLNSNEQSHRKQTLAAKSNGRVELISQLDPNRKFDAESLFKEIIQFGVSEEDISFLKATFENCLKDSSQNGWTEKVTWQNHPPTCDQTEASNIYSQNQEMQTSTGCSRSDGFFKVNKLSQPRFKISKKRSGSPAKAFYGRNFKGIKKSVSRDARNYQRRLSTAFETVSQSGLLRLNELKFRKKKLRLGKSEIHGLGLFALEPIAPNEIIIEYVGQLIRPIISDLREKLYKSSGLGSYCFKIDEDTIVDATTHGNLNRYINHSCNPNSYARILVIENKKKIVIYSKKAIKIDEEITYDYKLPLEDDKIMCLCRAPNCKKTLN